jgi:hypothetical protein
MNMTIDQIIALSASIAACLTAVATFLTVRQIAKQRASSYHPELAISRIYFHGLSDQLGMGPLPQYWAATSESGQVDDTLKQVAIPLYNVGLGTAKAVVVNWSFPIDELVKDVNELAKKTLIPEPFTYKDAVLYMKSDTFGTSTSPWKSQQRNSLDYVLPASVQNKPVLLDLPFAYKTLCSALIFFQSKYKETWSFEEIPALKASFEYLDIGEHKHKAVFEIKINLIWTGFKDGREVVSFFGYLESKKCM